MVISFRLKLNIATAINTTWWKVITIIEFRIVSQGMGSSKKERQAAMWVVNKKGRIGSKTGTSKVPIIVNNKMIAIVETIGPLELSEKQDRQMERLLMVNKAKKATQNAPA